MALDVFSGWLRVTNEWRPSRFQPQRERLDRVRPTYVPAWSSCLPARAIGEGTRRAEFSTNSSSEVT